MPRFARFSVALSFVTAFAVTTTTFAETPPTAATDSANPLPATPAPKPKRDRVISDGLAASLAASMPKYNPPPKPKADDEDVDLRDIDKPRNGIVRLPKYTVQGQRPPVFRERDIYSNKGLADLARRRYLTPTYKLLNGFYIPFLTASPTEHALAMYAEDERLNNMSELDDTARDVSRTNPADGTYIKRLSNETYMRTSDFGYQRKEP